MTPLLRRRRRGTDDARTVMLAAIRAARDAGGTTAGDVVREYRTGGEYPPGDPALLERLVDRLVDYRAQVRQVPDAAAVPAALVDVLRESGVRSAVVPPWLDSAWVSAAVAADVSVVPDTPGAPLSAARLDAMDAVVTAARVAIADTGTIVLDADADQGRRAITLVPDLHVCVVRADQVVQTVPDAVALLDRAPERPLTWISGPSATSDIELSRVEGVHGPRTLLVLLVG